MPITTQPYFTYQPLSNKSSEVRLVTLESGTGNSPIRCTLSHHDLVENHVAYIALSYEWGKPETRRWIWMDGCGFYVQPNLLAALRAIRRPECSILLWIDAMCVDQDNLRERGDQVTLMPLIYSQADLVVAWLGLQSDSDQLAFDLLENPLAEEVKEEHLSAIRSIGLKSYWRRAWIRQELFWAEQVMIRCGSRTISWRLFLSRYSDCLRQSYRYNGQSVRLTEKQFYNDRVLQLGVYSQASYIGSRTLQSVLALFHHAECADPRDRIYSLLSLANDDETAKFQAEYDIPRNVLFFALMEYCSPEDPLSFAWHLGEMLELRTDETLSTAVYQDREKLKQSCGPGSVALTRGLKFIDKLRPEMDRFLNGDGCGNQSNSWKAMCTTCARTMCRPSEGITRQDQLYQVGLSDVALVMRPGLTGLYLHALAQRETTSAGSEVWRMVKSEAKHGRFSRFEGISSKDRLFITLLISLTNQDAFSWEHTASVLAKKGGRLPNLQTKVLCHILVYLSDVLVPSTPFYRLDMRQCAWLMELYDLPLKCIGDGESDEEAASMKR